MTTTPAPLQLEGVKCIGYESEASRRIDKASQEFWKTVEEQTSRQSEHNGRAWAKLSDVEDALSRIVITIKPIAEVPPPALGVFAMENKTSPQGLYRRYNISKTNGEPIDEQARYFVLRYDGEGDDKKHIQACRDAIEAYCDSLDRQQHLPELVKDLRHELKVHKSWDEPTPEQFKPGDWVVCVEDNDGRDQLGKMFEVCYADDAFIGFVKPTPQWYARRFRRATPAEVAAHKQANAQPDADGWIPHDGDTMPVDGEAVVQIRMSGYALPARCKAREFVWTQRAGITHYRLVPSPQPVLNWVEVVTR